MIQPKIPIPKNQDNSPRQFNYATAYETIARLPGDDANSIYNSYVSYQETLASSLTQQQTHIGFIRHNINPFSQPPK